MEDLSYIEFVYMAIERLRAPTDSRGIHSGTSGFNDAFRAYFSEPPEPVIEKLEHQGHIETRPARDGIMIYLPGEAPEKGIQGADMLVRFRREIGIDSARSRDRITEEDGRFRARFYEHTSSERRELKDGPEIRDPASLKAIFLRDDFGARIKVIPNELMTDLSGERRIGMPLMSDSRFFVLLKKLLLDTGRSLSLFVWPVDDGVLVHMPTLMPGDVEKLKRREMKGAGVVEVIAGAKSGLRGESVLRNLSYRDFLHCLFSRLRVASSWRLIYTRFFRGGVMIHAPSEREKGQTCPSLVPRRTPPGRLSAGAALPLPDVDDDAEAEALAQVCWRETHALHLLHRISVRRSS